MSTNLQPIKLWGAGGPNPPKVAMILEELGVPYDIEPISFDKVKSPEYLSVNPNGRIPAIRDPNSGLTLWESGAILEYLIERYDTDHKLSFAPGTNESYLARQWLYFQTTGQGPYYGQMMFFKKYHTEKIPSAVERYVKEINRVTGVLEGWLGKQKEEHGDAGDGPWLVGGKLSFADIAFIPWQIGISDNMSKEEFDVDRFPLVKAWLGKMMEREAIKTVWGRAQDYRAKMLGKVTMVDGVLKQAE